MGLLLSVFSSRPRGVARRVLLLGFDNAGKTTMLYQMKTKETLATIPTMGFNVETVRYSPKDNVIHAFTFWDIGGQTRLRQLWRHYYPGSDVVCFMVDSTDTERLSHVKEAWESVHGAEDLPEKVVYVILANKQDKQGALTKEEVHSRMGLAEGIPVFPCCALDGTGMTAFFEHVLKTSS